MKNRSAALVTAFSAFVPLAAFAANHTVQPTDTKPGSATADPSSAAVMTEGEVKKIDKETGKLTIKHGPITNLGMPGMTMVFGVKNPAMLDNVKQGDKIRFHVERAAGALTVTELVPTK